MENGLFSIVFIAIPLYRVFRTIGIIKKSVILVAGVAFCVLALIPIVDMMNDTLVRYAERSSDAASSSSLGNKLNLLPQPLEGLAKACFSQFLPFPIWLRLTTGESYAYLRIVESFFPLYWIPIWMALFYGWWKYRRKWDRDLLIIFYISILYILLNSMGEFQVRRLMAVYPALYVCFLLLQQQFQLKKREMNKLSFSTYFFLHIVYLFITV